VSETLLGVNNGLYSTSHLTFVACAQNYVIWAEFSSNHLLSIG